MKISAVLFFLLLMSQCTAGASGYGNSSGYFQPLSQEARLQNEGEEDFREFIHRFSYDSVFQLSRVKFPLSMETFSESGEIVTIKVEKKKWEHLTFFNYEYMTTLYDNFKGELRDTGERLFALEGLGSGVNAGYYFKRIDNKWYLVKMRDLSN